MKNRDSRLEAFTRPLVVDANGYVTSVLTAAALFFRLQVDRRV